MTAEQPMPIPNDSPVVQELVIDDMRERLRIGIARYGTGLQVGNGRDMMRDAYEEALDLATYLRGVIEERNTTAAGVIAEVLAEMGRQDATFGQQDHRDGTGGEHAPSAARIARNACQHAALQGRVTWKLILLEEVYEALAESDPALLRAELIQVVAVAVQWVLAIDRRQAAGTPAVTS